MYRALMLLAVLAFPGLVAAGPTTGPSTAVWGVFRCATENPSACEHLPEVERALEKRLQFLVLNPKSLRVEGAPLLPACAPSQCAQQLSQACPTGSGRVIGVVVQQQKSLIQVRSWLYDLTSHQLAVKDNYCQSCIVTNAVLDTVKPLLVENPEFGSANVGATPSYCSAAPTSSRESLTRTSGRVTLLVLGDGKHRAVVRDGLIEHLRLLGRQPVVMQADRKQLGLADLRKLLDGDKRSQVLAIEMTPQGVELSLFDGTTEKTEPQHLTCDSCEQRQLVDKIKSAAGALLDHCFGEACADIGGQAKAPPEACIPFPDIAAPALRDNTGIQTVYAVDPNFAKLTKGALWGLFAASAATTVGLAIANNYLVDYTDATGRTPDGGIATIKDLPLTNGLKRATWTAGIISTAILGISIPISVGLSHTPVVPIKVIEPVQQFYQCNL